MLSAILSAMFFRVLPAVIALLACPWAASALGPHEVLVLANESSPRSVGVAKEFCSLRGVPPQNLVRLRLPAAAMDGAAEVSADDFTGMIWTPALRVARERGIDRQILAWVYSVDFPVRIKTTPPVSIVGMTFLRNRLPRPEDIERGRYVSPLFAGPSRPSAVGHLPQTFDLLNEWLGRDMPLPAMMLGYAGERGNTPEEIIACLKKGAYADGTAPSGTVYFVTSKDVRSECRAWEYPEAAKELMKLGVEAVVTPRFPEGRRDVMGIMMGAADVEPGQVLRYLPGAMAEHLTSAGAIFHGGAQSKISAWIAAGATASAGAVAEPYALWPKFPHARFFAHYASGCTMIESFFQSLRCPLQILPIGDPLAAPWAPQDKLMIQGLAGETASGTLRLRAEIAPGARGHYGKVVFLIDGRTTRTGRAFELDTRSLAEGSHTVRAVAYRTGLVRSQIFEEQSFTVKNGGRP